jgi:hypothetical protein
MITKSLATDRNYVVFQASLRDNKLHIQGEGVSVNRPYGVAEDFPVNNPEYFQALKPTALSLAGTKKEYFRLQGVVNGDKVHFQIKDGKDNRDYGKVLDIAVAKIPKVAEFIQKELAQFGESVEVEEIDSDDEF